MSLALVGLLLGMMIGRLTQPVPSVLERIEVVPGGLVLMFNVEPKIHGEEVDGTLALLFDAKGRAASGRLPLADKPVTWRVQDSQEGLLLNFVAARPLQGDWWGEELDGRWRLVVNLREK